MDDDARRDSKSLRRDSDWTLMDDRERSDSFDLMHERGRGSFDLEQPSELPDLGLHSNRFSKTMSRELSTISKSARASRRGSARVAALMVADTFMMDDVGEESDEDDHTPAPMARHRSVAVNDRGKRQSVFQAKTVENLEASKPGIAAWLETSKGILAQVAMIALFMALDVARPLLYRFATSAIIDKENRPIPGVLTGSKNVLAILLSFSLSIAQDGREGAWNCLPTIATVKLIPVASLATAANILSIFALDHIDAGTFKLLMQMGLPTTAILSFFLVGRRYTVLQLQSLAFALVATTAFFSSLSNAIAKSDAHSKKDNEKSVQELMIGALWTVTCFVSTSSSAVLGERFLTRDKRPYNAQKVQMEIAGVPMSAIAVLTHPSFAQGYPKGAFVGWTWKLEVALVEWVLAGWLTGFIVKHFSALVKRLLQGGAAIFTYIISVLCDEMEPTFLVNMNAVLVVQAIMLFFSSPAPEVAKKTEAAAVVTSVQLATVKQ